MRDFIGGHAFFAGMALIFLLLSIICRIITGVSLKKLIGEAENMSVTENLLLKQCKLKFQNCCQLNGGAVNASVFTEKFLQNIRLGKCSLRFLELLSGQFLLLSVFASGLGSCIGLAFGESLGQVLPYYLMVFLTLYVYFGISGLMDVTGKRSVLKTAITDFLENRLAERIRSTEQDSSHPEEEKRAEKQQTAEISRVQSELVTAETREELETLLREFLA